MPSRSNNPTSTLRFSKKMHGAATTTGPFPEAKILGYQFRNSYLLSEAFLQRTEPMKVDGQDYPDGNRRLAVLGASVLRTMMAQIWYETEETKQQFHLWFQLISKNSFLSKIALVNGFDVVVIGLGGDLAERNGLPLWVTEKKKQLSEKEVDRIVKEERANFDRQMANVVTALIGAVFNDCDGSVEKVVSFIWNLGIKKPALAQDGVGIGVDVGRREMDLEKIIEEIERERKRKRVAEQRAAQKRAAEVPAMREECTAEELDVETRAVEEGLAAEEQAVQGKMAKEVEYVQSDERRQQSKSQEWDDEMKIIGERKVLKRWLSPTGDQNPSPPCKLPRLPVPQGRGGCIGPGPTMRF